MNQTLRVLASKKKVLVPTSVNYKIRCLQGNY